MIAPFAVEGRIGKLHFGWGRVKRDCSAERYNKLFGDSARPVSNARAAEGCMFEVTVDDTFAAGHYLRNYKGKCENPHGHNYKIRVTLAGAELDKAGLLLDFKDLREVMKHVIERLDHQMINDIEPFTVINPSAENLAKYFYDESNTRLKNVTSGRVRVKNVTVYETDTTTATYSE
jgi:6-pyruvoyltetrahydropterin/6-carboxytetrahydropterin synthase